TTASSGFWHRALVLAFSVVILVATAFLFIRIPKGFVPDSDNDQILIQTEAEQGISFEEMSRNQGKVAEMVRKDPSVLAFYSGVNGSNAGNGGSNFGRMFIHLKPRVERGSLDSIIGRLRQKLGGLPYMRAYIQ